VRRLHGLDALRGIAAFSVVLYHVVSLYGLKGAYPMRSEAAVDLFFILSGLVMARSYETRLREGMTTRQFLSARYGRLFLPLAIGSTLGLVWALLTFGPSLSLIAAYFLILSFLPAPWIGSSFLLNGPAWSLFEEIVANGLHAMILARLNIQRLFSLWVGVTIVFVVLFMRWSPHWGPGLGQISLLFPREFSCYLMGILLYRRYGDTPLGGSPIVAIAAASGMLFAGQLVPILDLAATLIVAPLLIRASIGLKEAAWASWLGALSYPLYATHFTIIRLSILGHLPPIASAGLAISVASVLTVLFEARRKATRVNTVDGQPSGQIATSAIVQ
jgi:peptidoglycan/LPS O-acetylase OafA/YrhL